MTLQLPLGGPSDGGMSWPNGIPGLILSSRFGTCARGHRKFEEEDVLENTGVRWSYAVGHLCDSRRNFESGRDRQELV